MIRLRTLGALDVRGSDSEELRAVLAQPKRAALLTYLALATPRGPHRRDTLLALFWPELDADHARDALSQAVRFLRRSLGAELLISRNGDELDLEWEQVWCDAVAFEEELNAGRLADALELYRGELLEGFHVTNAPEFERWLQTERERLSRRCMRALEDLANEREVAGDSGGATTWWRRLAARDPYSSRVALRLMRVLASSGDAGGAVRHAHVHETLLREELEVPPDPEVVRFVRQLQSEPAEEGARPPSPVARLATAETPGRAESGGETAGTSPGEPMVPSATHAQRALVTTDSRADHGPRRHRRAAMVAAGLLALCAAGGGAAIIGNRTRAPAIPLIRSLAVLPLENLSGDSAHQLFANGMHDALITELARYPELTVISRTSVLRYKESRKSLPEIARELNVDGVIEGTVLREGGRVRMNAQLVHGPSDRHLWTESYRRDLRDILHLQGELAAAIAREVRVATRPVERPRGARVGRTDSVPDELYLRELYLRGRHAEISRSPIGIQTAKEAYRRAIERDSTFALGYAGLASVYSFMADYDFAPLEPSLDSARMMARRAVELDSTLPEARAALAVTLGDAGQFEAAEREFRRAIQLGPSNARAHYWYSILLVALGRGEEALREAQRAKELDPFAPRGLTGMLRYSHWLITGARPYLKLPVSERRPILKLEPGEPWARGQEALEYAQEGHCSKARVELARAQRLAPDSRRMIANVASVFWLCGERARARALVEEMKRRPDANDHADRVGLAYITFGEKDSALVWLARNRWTMGELSGLSADQRYDALRSDPRFPQLLDRVGIRSRQGRQN